MAITPRPVTRARLVRLARRTARVVAAGACVAMAASVLAVVALRWVSPPTTAFMLQHQIEGWRSGVAGSSVRYQWVDWADINPELAVAVVAAEDQRFRQHHGLDFDAISDALEERRRDGRLRGASTISQQVAKNLFLWSGQSWLRKGIESYLTVLIELVWSKRRVLEVYLNVAEFGNGVYGVGAASHQFLPGSPRVSGASRWRYWPRCCRAPRDFWWRARRRMCGPDKSGFFPRWSSWAESGISTVCDSGSPGPWFGARPKK